MRAIRFSDESGFAAKKFDVTHGVDAQDIASGPQQSAATSVHPHRIDAPALLPLVASALDHFQGTAQ